MEDFERWLYDLNLQTLTDELKEEIITKVEELCDEYKAEGYHEAKDNMILFIENDL